MGNKPDYYLTITFKPESKVIETEYRRSEPIPSMTDKDARIWASRLSGGLGSEYLVTLVKDGVVLATFDQL